MLFKPSRICAILAVCTLMKEIGSGLKQASRYWMSRAKRRDFKRCKLKPCSKLNGRGADLRLRTGSAADKAGSPRWAAGRLLGNRYAERCERRRVHPDHIVDSLRPSADICWIRTD